MGRVAELGLSTDSAIPHADAAPPAGATCLAGASLGRAQRTEDRPPGGRRESADARGPTRAPGDRPHG